MNVLADSIYRLTRPAACIASALTPELMHPGKRAKNAAASLQITIADRQFTQALLESSYRCYWLHKHVSRLRSSPLHDFLADRVEYDGAITPGEIQREARPVILATPHYGEPMVGAVAMAHLLGDEKTLNIFYDRERHGEHLQPFFEGAGLKADTLFSGLAGVRAALRALSRGECLALLPDAFDDIDQTVVVPFYGRLLRVASGTAFLALRANALIVPAFAVPSTRLGLRITFGAPIDPARVAAEDESQALFTLTHLLFSRIEAQLSTAPQHWRYWEILPHVSTPLGTSVPIDGPQLLQALKAKFHALPPAVQDIPELELLLE
jgi:lauroyl/myristoyl acyltransferase